MECRQQIPKQWIYLQNHQRSSERNAWILLSSAVRHRRRILTMKITGTSVVLLIQIFQCLALDDSPFQLTNKATSFCLVKTNNQCNDIRWTTSDRLLVQQRKKCLGVQGSSVGSEVSLYDCDEKSELQQWECKNETALALKGQQLYIELTADGTAVLSRTIGPNNQLTISGTSSGACTRTYRELYAIGGNAAGMPCMFPFHYNDQWYSDCTRIDNPENRLWCAVETKYDSERWGYCPITSKDDWHVHPTTGAYYQLNTQSALTWPQAETSCKQQGASLLSITDPHEQAYITVLLGKGGNKLWTGLILNPEHGWKWSNRRPYRYMKWDSGHPLPNPGYNCAIIDPAVQYAWQSSPCTKKLGYICYSKTAEQVPTQAVETGFCSRPWIPYNGHCFYLNRTQITWSDAQRECRNGGGDLVSIRNVEDQSFVISQLGYASTDELWIGLNDRKTEGLFDWIDHSTVSFTSWEIGKPVVSTDVKDCVLIRGENGNWADSGCEEKHGFICMKMSASQPTGDEVQQEQGGCKTRWRRHGSYCYFIGTQTKTFDEAKEDCKSSDSYLADVSRGVDNAFLVSLVGLRPEKYFWLGLSNQKNIDKFVWTNRDSVSFTHWNTEMPGNHQGCVAMRTGIFAGLWDVLPCTNREKYICKQQAEGAALTPAPPTPTSTKCADGWTHIGSRNYCLKYFPEPDLRHNKKARTWYEARDYCRAIGGDLLSIHSAAEQEVLPDGYGETWIGLSAPDTDTGYVWSDGSPLQFQHWASGEPNNVNNVESCVQLKLHWREHRGSWNDVHCEIDTPWLCQIRAGVTPKPPPDNLTPDYNRTSDGWLEWNGNQYYINNRGMAMEEARSFCKQRHGDLTTINSEAESIFLWKRIMGRYQSLWIGLTVDLDKTYAWVDGSPVVFQRWDENQPAFLNNDENCAIVSPQMGFWKVYGCGFEYSSICKRSGSPPANATVPPTVLPTGGCPQNWKKFESKCYNIINDRKVTWDAAKTQCQTLKGNVASISSRKVQVMLAGTMVETNSTDLWIGSHNRNHNPFYWTDGRPMRYTNWGNSLRQVYHHHHSLYEDDYQMETTTYRQCVAISLDPNSGIGKWKKTSCNNTNGYICLKDLDPSLPDSPEPTTAEYVQIQNDSFKVVAQQMTWGAAKKHCQDDQAKLVRVVNDWTKAYIEMLALKGRLWIGMNKNETGGYFKYVDGWRMTLSNWAYREPSMDRSCVYVDVDGKWKTADCNTSMTCVCMKSTDVPPTESSNYPGFCPEKEDTSMYRSETATWIPYRQYCYLFVTQRIEWPDASVRCMKHGGSLASIEDPYEQDFIYSNIQRYQDSHNSFWIGFFKTHKGMWLWLDRTVVDYTNWARDIYPGYDYGAITTRDGRWSAANRYQDKGYICKTTKILRQVPPTAVNPTVGSQTRGRMILVTALVITAVAIGTAIGVFLFKKSGRSLPIPERLSTFDNPLFFNNERSKSNVVDTNKLVANAEEENSGAVINV